MVSDTVGEPIAAKRGKHRAPEWSASILEARPSMWAAQGTKFEGKYQIKKQRLKLVLIPHAFCYGFCTPLHGFALNRRSQICLSVSANPPVNICLSGGGWWEHLEILGGKNVIQSTFPTKGPQILDATVQNLVARDLCSAGLGRQFLAVSSFQTPIPQAPSLHILHC